MKLEIKQLFIENDIVNDSPKLVAIDEIGQEWVLETYHGEAPPVFIKKEDDWYFKTKEDRD